MTDPAATTDRGWSHRWLPPLLLAAAVLWLHWPAGAEFKADDYPAIRYASDWRNCLGDFVGPQYDLNFFRFWRPVVTTTLGIDYWLFGTEPFGFYAETCLALVVSTVLMFSILAALFRSRAIAFTATVLWVCHPYVVISQRCWAAGRVDTHLVPPLLAAVWLHLRARRGGPRWPVCIAAMVAIGAKESAVGFPLIALGIDLLDPRPSRRGRFPALPYLLLIPAFFLLRWVTLGDFIAGYDAINRATIDPIQVASGVWAVLATSIVPNAPPAVTAVAAALLVGAAVWSVVRAGRPAPVLAGAALVGAGLFGPLARLLPSMLTTGDRRWAYLVCSLMLIAWAGVVRAWVGRGGRAVAVGLVPLLWLIPARIDERRLMDSHDRFVASLTAAMKECGALLPPGEPVVVVGSSSLVRHSFRFSWGLAASIKPPFTESPRELIFVGEFMTGSTTPPTEWIRSGAWVEVHEGGGRVVTGATVEHRAVEPVGFSGTLTASVLDDVIRGGRIGYRVGDDYDGRLAFCATLGSLATTVAPDGGVLLLRDVLMANAIPDTAHRMPICEPMWVPADLDTDSPMYLFWREADRIHRAELRVTQGFVDRYLELSRLIGLR